MGDVSWARGNTPEEQMTRKARRTQMCLELSGGAAGSADPAVSSSTDHPMGAARKARRNQMCLELSGGAAGSADWVLGRLGVGALGRLGAFGGVWVLGRSEGQDHRLGHGCRNLR